jgi:hypothetical protein
VQAFSPLFHAHTRTIQEPYKFFRDVRRQRSSPFWVDEQLKILPACIRNPQAQGDSAESGQEEPDKGCDSDISSNRGETDEGFSDSNNECPEPGPDLEKFEFENEISNGNVPLSEDFGQYKIYREVCCY